MVRLSLVAFETPIVAAILSPSKRVRSTLPRPNSIGISNPICMTEALSLMDFVFTNISLFRSPTAWLTPKCILEPTTIPVQFAVDILTF